MHLRKILPTLALAAFAGLSASARAQTEATAAPQPSPTPQAAAEAPAPAPAIRLKALDGKIFDLAERKGQVVVASFGATWCVPCVWELKAVEELVEEYEGKPVQFIWISIESKERTSDSILKHFVKTYRLTIPVLRDHDASVMAQFSDSRRIPLVVYFDTEGKYIEPAQRGMASDPIQYKERVRRRIDALLAAGAAKPSEASN